MEKAKLEYIIAHNELEKFMLKHTKNPTEIEKMALIKFPKSLYDQMEESEIPREFRDVELLTLEDVNEYHKLIEILNNKRKLFNEHYKNKKL